MYLGARQNSAESVIGIGTDKRIEDKDALNQESENGHKV